MIILFIILVIVVSIAWKREDASRVAADREFRDSPEFRDIPGNKYYKASNKANL